ncbi:MAG: c-type cytochrome [Bacteroidota bacterium]
MKILTRSIRTIILVAAIFGIQLKSQAQSADEGGKLFNANCVSCHAINTKVVGPALKNVHKKYDEAWIIKWVKNSPELVKSGDAKAVKVFEENNKIPMTAFSTFTDNQVKSIIAYIKVESDKAPVAAAANASSVANDNANEDKTNWTNWILVLVIILLLVVLKLTFDILERYSLLSGKQVINWFKINAALLLVFLIVGMIAAIWEFIKHGPLTVNSQTPASAHGAIYDSMFTITLVLTGIVFIITQILLFWYGYRYQHNEKRKALFYPDNHKLEFIWTIIPAIVLTVLVVRGLQTWSSITDRKQSENAQQIEVFGFQFAWNVRYAGADNKLGAHDFRKIGVINALGVDTNDAASKDDIVTTELHLKVGQAVVLKFRSKDVIHSAYLPHFRVQMNVVPGLPTQFTFTPIVTTAQMRDILHKPEFDYIMLCNKICGSAHYRMKMKVVVDSPDEYNKWLSEQPKLVPSNNPEKEISKPIASK